jgi:hypothetical protein
VLVYGASRARYLVTGGRPNISMFTIHDARNGTQLVDLNEHNFKVAFTVNAIRADDEVVHANDPNYVEWMAYLYDTDGLNYTSIKVH